MKKEYPVRIVKNCMRAGLCEKHHCVHPNPLTPTPTETWEIKLDELKHYFRYEEAYYEVKSVLKYHIDELLSHQRTTVLREVREKYTEIAGELGKYEQEDKAFFLYDKFLRYLDSLDTVKPKEVI